MLSPQAPGRGYSETPNWLKLCGKRPGKAWSACNKDSHARDAKNGFNFFAQPFHNEAVTNIDCMPAPWRMDTLCHRESHHQCRSHAFLTLAIHDSQRGRGAFD